MDSDREAFLRDVVFGIALNGTAQRGKLYREGSGETERRALRSALRRALENLIEQYRNGLSEAEHIANIDQLAQMLSAEHADALNSGRFRIGSAQKALNLYLKLLWCLDRIPTPPHCPFDAIVLSRVPGCEHVRWTQLDSLPEYQRIVACARTAAHDGSLAEWELHLYTAALSAGRVGDIV
jgi:hypothetical protein